MRGLRLIKRQWAVPFPIHYRRIVRLRLLGLIFRFAGQTLRGQHVFYPVLDGHLHRAGLPIGLVFRDLVLFPSIPIHHRAHEFVGGHSRLDLALPVRQFNQGFHHVRLRTGRLERVIDAPEPPHAGHVVLRDVAVKHKFSGQGLETAGAALDDFIENLRRPDGLDVQPVGGVAHRRKLDRPVFAQRRIELTGAGLSRPTD